MSDDKAINIIGEIKDMLDKIQYRKITGIQMLKLEDIHDMTTRLYIATDTPNKLKGECWRCNGRGWITHPQSNEETVDCPTCNVYAEDVVE